MTDAVEIRGLEPGDAEGVCDLLRVVVPTCEARTANLVTGAWRAHTSVAAATGSGALVGVVSGTVDEAAGTAYVAVLGVRAAYRDCGVGTRLMERFHSGLPAALCEASLHVQASSADALRFYARLGYRSCGDVVPRYYRARRPADSDALPMSRPLAKRVRRQTTPDAADAADADAATRPASPPPPSDEQPHVADTPPVPHTPSPTRPSPSNSPVSREADDARES